MPDGVIWVTVKSDDGTEDEFEGLGNVEHYRLGRLMTVREFIFPPSGGKGRVSTYPAEIWIGDRRPVTV
ncbi:hypothetical protein [Actinacidiphila yeochonensis]|uniref:hypothetical protein n=1 Tax=Actinacidiphila yeochonensis TaxID=89050 RepID=UPI0012FEDCA6|nr:hypothetical protein [Actinacidiphila yeochonensis]